MPGPSSTRAVAPRRTKRILALPPTISNSTLLPLVIPNTCRTRLGMLTCPLLVTDTAVTTRSKYYLVRILPCNEAACSTFGARQRSSDTLGGRDVRCSLTARPGRTAVHLDDARGRPGTCT